MYTTKLWILSLLLCACSNWKLVSMQCEEDPMQEGCAATLSIRQNQLTRGKPGLLAVQIVEPAIASKLASISARGTARITQGGPAMDLGDSGIADGTFRFVVTEEQSHSLAPGTATLEIEINHFRAQASLQVIEVQVLTPATYTLEGGEAFLGIHINSARKVSAAFKAPLTGNPFSDIKEFEVQRISALQGVKIAQMPTTNDPPAMTKSAPIGLGNSSTLFEYTKQDSNQITLSGTDNVLRYYTHGLSDGLILIQQSAKQVYLRYQKDFHYFDSEVAAVPDDTIAALARPWGADPDLVLLTKRQLSVKAVASTQLTDTAPELSAELTRQLTAAGLQSPKILTSADLDGDGDFDLLLPAGADLYWLPTAGRLAGSARKLLSVPGPSPITAVGWAGDTIAVATQQAVYFYQLNLKDA